MKTLSLLILIAASAFAQARHVSSAQTVALEKRLSTAIKQRIAIVTVKEDGERADFARDLRTALLKCGFDPGLQYMESFRLDGPGVLVLKHSQQNMPDIQPILGALTGAGFPVKVVEVGNPAAFQDRDLYYGDVDTDTVIIFIGRVK